MPGNIINLTPADIAKWPTPNYDDPVRRHWMPEYAGVLYGIATLVVVTRLWLRMNKRAGGLGFDDVLLICGWLSLSWFTALSIVGAEQMMTSRHMWDIPITMYENTALITWIAELAFLVCGCFVKVSVLLFYRRLVDNSVSKYWIWTVIIAIVFTIAYSLAFILTLVLNCAPTEAYWKAFSPAYTTNYTCVNTTVVNLLAGLMAIVSDLYSVFLPCMMTRHLQLPTAQKLGLYIIFSLGLLAVAASGVRTYWLYKVGHSSDVSTSIYYVFVWAQLELSLGIMCTALPSLRVLFREYLSEPFIRLRRSVTSSRRMSDVEQGIVQRVATPDLEHRQVHYSVKHTPTSSTSTCEVSPTEAEEDITKDASWTREIPYLVRTPAEYESFNLYNMEKYRQSAHARDWSRSTKGRSAVEVKEKSFENDRSWLSSRDS
ncbi:hypothetical protein Slin15195_G058170 [Septoria linicola]|uniref:Rhodopsin domain-containing protein n=1 Tax=Septoria linicola TaxID=215465 RepID=A0A9Q9AUR6_9PEZI|nr:hypothetical protein Slin14017_G074030 [Septoria linicola]USW52498.1 hypothetical protein Slin15195_G058170 [Septoria linicola]